MADQERSTGANVGTVAGTLPPVVVTGTRIPKAPTSAVPNPLHQYASYTYNFSWWWMDPSEFNDVTNTQNAGKAQAYPLTKSSVIAEQGGIYANQRLPSTAGLNYYITDVEFKTTIGLNGAGKASNLVEGRMTIIEPTGMSLIDALVAASLNPATGKFESYTTRPFMLQLDFQGYDDKGAVINPSVSNQLRKRFPIRITEFKVELGLKGTVYTVKFCNYNAEPVRDQIVSTTPKIFSVKADTVGAFFDDLKKQWNTFLTDQVKKGVEYADQFDFQIEDAIKKSKIIDSKKITIKEMAATDTELDPTKRTFTIPKGTTIVDIVNRVMAQSEYLQLQITKNNGDQTNIMSAFKVTNSVTLEGAKSPGNSQPAVHDSDAQKWPKKYTIKIGEFKSWNTISPHTPNQLSDSTPYVTKSYNYMYTGQNVDIVELKVNFDMSFFTMPMAYTDVYASQSPTASTGLETLLTNSPSVLFGQGTIAKLTGLNAFRNPTPLQMRLQTNNKNVTIGMGGLSTPESQKALDWLNSIYTDSASGDMVKPTMRIVGDPTLLKQDDWLYNTDPSKGDDYDKWDTMSQLEYTNKYGHVRMDVGDLIVSLKINAPLDVDTDITNAGLVYPPVGSTPSTFDGQYRIIEIKNEFRNGKFEQVLTMTKYTNDALIKEYKDAVSQYLNNSTNTGNTNR